jgi:adenosylmethionine-8-amino-7-oxononanoate aminotransferase
LFERFLGERGERRTFFHGHTYTGNPLACAAGLASLEIFRSEGTLEKLQPKIAHATQLLATIGQMRAVKEVRQRGLMIGIELHNADTTRPLGAEVCAEARKRGVLLRPLGPVVVWMPPLSITIAELERLASSTRAAIETAIETVCDG